MNKRDNEFVLKCRPNGRHYEEFFWLGNHKSVIDVMQQAYVGRLNGHIPQSDEVYGARCWFYPNSRVLVKLTFKQKPKRLETHVSEVAQTV